MRFFLSSDYCDTSIGHQFWPGHLTFNAPTMSLWRELSLSYAMLRPCICPRVVQSGVKITAYNRGLEEHVI